MKIFFTDFFEVEPLLLDKYNAFNISLINDLPLFVDPFLLFASDKKKYRKLHAEIIKYLKYLRNNALAAKSYTKGAAEAWYMFPEVKQLWLGYCLKGNDGKGLGEDFANNLYLSLHKIFTDFGDEKVAQSSHLEKLCLIDSGIGKDSVSDFTANLIKNYLCKYTEKFAKKYISQEMRKTFNVNKALFNYDIESWVNKEYDLPCHNGDYVLLAPRDILSKDDNWINHKDLCNEFEKVVTSCSNASLQAQLSSYLEKKIDECNSKKERNELFSQAAKKHPEIIEHYIKYKEDTSEDAIAKSKIKISESRSRYVNQISALSDKLQTETDFYAYKGDTYNEAMQRVKFLKHVLEDRDGYRLLYLDGKPIQRENDLQILYILTWFASELDCNREVNNGRGPVDFKVSHGRRDSTLVEMKLAKNSWLRQNLENQVEIYKKANATNKAIKVILYFTEDEYKKVYKIRKELNLLADDNIVLIDARNDNKPSASKAKSH